MSEKLEEFLKTGKDWGRIRTTVPGVFVLKLPEYKRSPTRLAIELNPVDDRGSTTKRRGLVLRSLGELDSFNELFKYDKLSKLMDMLEEVNPKIGTGRARKEEEVIEL